MPFPPTPSNTPSNTPTPSVTPSVTPTITPSSSSCPTTATPTPTITPTITPSRDVPTIYTHLCLPDVVPADGLVYTCSFATTENSCTASTTTVLDYVVSISDIGVIDDFGEFLPLYSTGGCDPLYPGQSCNCECYYDFGAELSGYTLSSITYNVFTTGTTLQANYIHTIDCFIPECTQCLTPTPTITATLTPTPTITPTLTNTPTITPSACVAADYLLFNETGSPLSWTGIDCNGNGVGDTIPGGQQASTGCIQVGSLSEGSLTIVSTTPC